MANRNEPPAEERPAVYLDYMAATPCVQEVTEAMLPFFSERFYNAQSSHPAGEETLEAVEAARAQVAHLIGAASPKDVLFTSGATEANNWALKGTIASPWRRGKHVVTSRIEHLSIMHPCKTLERQSVAVTYVPVDPTGAIEAEVVRRALRPDTVLVSLTHASNELGTIEPIAEIAAVCREAGVPLHVDASNTAGFVPIDVEALGVDLLTISPHLFYGPKGIGALYCRRGLRPASLMEGGTQEEGRRPGTENVPAIVGFGKACLLAGVSMEARRAHLVPLRDRLVQALAQMPGVRITGHPTNRLPHHVSCLIEQVSSESVVMDLAMGFNVYASSGSACSAKAEQHSYVLEAIGVGAEARSGAVVFGLGIFTTPQEIDYLVQSLPAAIRRLRALSPLR